MKKLFKKYEANSGKFKGQLVVTVCTLWDLNGKVGRGVSVCSPFDDPGEETGEWWAHRYAMRALKNREGGLITDYRAIQTIIRTDCPFIMQSEKNPKLTFQEAAFFYGKRKVKPHHLVEPSSDFITARSIRLLPNNKWKSVKTLCSNHGCTNTITRPV